MSIQNLKVKEIIVLHQKNEPDWAEMQVLAEKTGNLVIWLGPGDRIEALSEEEMRAAGWVRA